MNKSYKSIFNARTGTYVAVSELTTRRGKASKSAVAALAPVALAIGLAFSLGGAPPANAQTVVGLVPSAAGGSFAVPAGSTNNVNGIAIGAGAGTSVSGSDNVATGTNAGQSVTGSNNTASGNSAGVSVSGSSNIASGTSAGVNVVGSNNTASGFNTAQIQLQSASVGSLSGVIFKR